ncbi:MAG: hypothetical protein ACI8RZ_001463 [Myxococcota bacterium]|jgi:hypothetical protein
MPRKLAALEAIAAQWTRDASPGAVFLARVLAGPAQPSDSTSNHAASLRGTTLSEAQCQILDRALVAAGWRSSPTSPSGAFAATKTTGIAP